MTGSRRAVPAGLASREAFKALVKARVDFWKVEAAYHVLRLPKYWGRLLLWVPRGFGVIVLALFEWTRDHNRDDALAGLRGDGGRALAVETEKHLRVVHIKSWLAGAAGVGSVGVLGAVWLTGGLFTKAGLVVLVTVFLGLMGRPEEARPVTDRVPADRVTPDLSFALLDEALSHIGLAGLNQAYTRAEKEPGFKAVVPVSEIARTRKGWNVQLDLPAGVTAAEVVERRSKLASGVRRPLGCVWPSIDPDAHEGRLVLDVIDQPISKQQARAWPLLKSGKVNIFEPVPIGVSPTGEAISVELMFASGLIGAVPRMGKSALLRLLCLAGSLDPRVQVHIFNLKGGGDYDPLEAVAHTYRAGDDPEDLDAALRALEQIQTDMKRRYKRLRELPKEKCPESKLTDELASLKKLGMPPVLVAADECQLWFESDQGGEFETLVSDLIRRGPAVGIMVWLATQRPDKNSIPTVVSANAVLRFCLKVTGQVENDMVLGTSMYKAGYRATTFSRKDLGVAWLAGEGEDPMIVQSDYVDTNAAEAVAMRARAVREAGNWLTGQAAGEEADKDPDTSTVVDHLLAVWPGQAKGEHGEVLAELLADRWDRYRGWGSEQVTKALKPHGVSSRDVKRKGLNRKGFSLADLEAVAANRGDRPEPPK